MPTFRCGWCHRQRSLVSCLQPNTFGQSSEYRKMNFPFPWGKGNCHNNHAIFIRWPNQAVRMPVHPSVILSLLILFTPKIHKCSLIFYSRQKNSDLPNSCSFNYSIIQTFSFILCCSTLPSFLTAPQFAESASISRRQKISKIDGYFLTKSKPLMSVHVQAWLSEPFLVFLPVYVCLPVYSPWLPCFL